MVENGSGGVTREFEKRRPPEVAALLRVIAERLRESEQLTGEEREHHRRLTARLAAPYVLDFYDEIVRLTRARRRLRAIVNHPFRYSRRR